MIEKEQNGVERIYICKNYVPKCFFPERIQVASLFLERLQSLHFTERRL